MHPPASTCRALSFKHPHLRLAWMGRPPAYPGEINCGDFAVVQLMHWRDSGSPDEPNTTKEFWHAQTCTDGNDVWTEKVERGPIFNKNGGTEPDWDPLVRRPVLLFTVTPDWGLSLEDVFTGDLQRVVDEWGSKGGRELAQKLLKAPKERGKRLEHRVEDLTKEMGRHLWYEANKTDQTAPVMAQKHARQDLTENYKNARDGKLGFKDYFLNKVPKKFREAAGE